MATFKQLLLADFNDNGLHPHMAEDAFKLVEQDEAMTPMRGRWNDNASDYPAAMVKLNWIGAKPIVAKFLAEHHPMAWFRPMFEQGIETTDDPDQFINDFWAKQPKPTLMPDPLNPCANVALPADDSQRAPGPSQPMPTLEELMGEAPGVSYDLPPGGPDMETMRANVEDFLKHAVNQGSEEINVTVEPEGDNSGLFKITLKATPPTNLPDNEAGEEKQ